MHRILDRLMDCIAWGGMIFCCYGILRVLWSMVQLAQGHYPFDFFNPFR